MLKNVKNVLAFHPLCIGMREFPIEGGNLPWNVGISHGMREISKAMWEMVKGMQEIAKGMWEISKGMWEISNGMWEISKGMWEKLIKM